MHRFFFAILFAAAVPLYVAYAQPAVSLEDLMAEADSAWAGAVRNEVLLFSPRRMGQAEESMRSARSQMGSQGAEQIVRLNLESALESIETATAHAEDARAILQKVLEARQSAQAAGAGQRNMSTWREAEKGLTEIAAKLEAGEDAEVESVREVLALNFYAARRETLRDGVMAKAKADLAEAVSKGVDLQFPTIYARAQQALSRSEAALAQENIEEAQLAAAEAERLAKHALGQSAYVKRCEGTRMTYESLLLPYDDLLLRLTTDWNDSISFEQGGDVAVQQFKGIFESRRKREIAMQDSIHQMLSTERETMERALSDMQTNLADQQNRIAEMEQRVLDIQAERDIAVNRLRKREMTAQRAQIAQTAFDAGDAVVYETADGHIVIHLYGLKFASGQATIGKDQRSILKKAAVAINVFPDITGVTVEGHTDAEGSEESNQELSEERAAAIGKALEAELKSGITVSTVGKGESAPIASNESARGRTLNRRIDLVITIP